MSLCVIVYCYVDIVRHHTFVMFCVFGTFMFLFVVVFGPELKCACLLHSALLHLTLPPVHTPNTVNDVSIVE